MEEYNFYCTCRLKHSICVDEIFIGKSIPIKLLSKYKGAMLFPVLKSREFSYDLVAPHIDDVIVRDVCGSYTETIQTKDRSILHPIIDKICFVINIYDDSGKPCNIAELLGELEQYTSKFIKCISLIHPTAVKWSYVNETGYVDPIRFCRNKNLNSNGWNVFVDFDVVFGTKADELSISEFWLIYKKLTSDIALQQELLSDVYRCYRRSEFREAVLNCATIIEKNLKDQIRLYLNLQKTADNITEFILKSADGFDKILKVMKKFGLSVDNCNDIKDRTIFIRNRVIHGGYFPTKEEVERAIEDAKLIMKQYNVPLFID